MTITLKIVEDPTLPDTERWRIGYDVWGQDVGSGSPCSASHDGYPSEAAAVDAAIRSIEKQLAEHLKSGGSVTLKKRIRMALDDLRASDVWRAQRKLLTPGSESDRLSWPNSTSPPLPTQKRKAKSGKRKGRGTCPDPIGHIEAAFGRLTTPPRKRQSTIPEPRAPRLSSPGALVPVAVAPKLNAVERKVLARAEQTIDEGMRTFVEVGEALRRIQVGQLYRETHETFDAYCRDRWDFAKSRAYQLIQGAAIAEQLAVSTNVDNRKKTQPRPVPQNEAQVRPLLRVDEDQRGEVWDLAVKRAAKEGKAAPTQAIVEETVREWITPGDELETKAESRKRKAETSSEPQVPNPAPLESCPDEQGWLYEIECVRSQIIRSLSVFPRWPRCHTEMARILRQLADGLEGVS
jgi:hypothetical protein